VCLDTTDDELVRWLRGKGIEIVPVSYRDTMQLGCNVVVLGDSRVLSTAASKELNGRLRALGFTVMASAPAATGRVPLVRLRARFKCRSTRLIAAGTRSSPSRSPVDHGRHWFHFAEPASHSVYW
jgi:hypothetical protein